LVNGPVPASGVASPLVGPDVDGGLAVEVEVLVVGTAPPSGGVDPEGAAAAVDVVDGAVVGDGVPGPAVPGALDDESVATRSTALSVASRSAQATRAPPVRRATATRSAERDRVERDRAAEAVVRRRRSAQGTGSP
jgi:hypothetical protein